MTPACTVLIPVKGGAAAKSRLAGDLDTDRALLMRAFARDAVTATLACPSVATVYVVSSDPETARWGVEVLPDEGTGDLNRALNAAAERVRASRGNVPVAALLGDLPCLRAADLELALTAYATGRWFVADAAGTGTTLLVAGGGLALDPRFGPGSAARHAESGARPVAAGVPTLRLDVDTATDLTAAVRLGVGPHTAALLGT